MATKYIDIDTGEEIPAEEWNQYEEVEAPSSAPDLSDFASDIPAAPAPKKGLARTLLDDFLRGSHQLAQIPKEAALQTGKVGSGVVAGIEEISNILRTNYLGKGPVEERGKRWSKEFAEALQQSREEVPIETRAGDVRNVLTQGLIPAVGAALVPEASIPLFAAEAFGDLTSDAAALDKPLGPAMLAGAGEAAIQSLPAGMYLKAMRGPTFLKKLTGAGLSNLANMTVGMGANMLGRNYALGEANELMDIPSRFGQGLPGLMALSAIGAGTRAGVDKLVAKRLPPPNLDIPEATRLGVPEAGPFEPYQGGIKREPLMGAEGNRVGEVVRPTILEQDPITKIIRPVQETEARAGTVVSSTINSITNESPILPDVVTDYSWDRFSPKQRTPIVISVPKEQAATISSLPYFETKTFPKAGVGAVMNSTGKGWSQFAREEAPGQLRAASIVPGRAYRPRQPLEEPKGPKPRYIMDDDVVLELSPKQKVPEVAAEGTSSHPNSIIIRPPAQGEPRSKLVFDKEQRRKIEQMEQSRLQAHMKDEVDFKQAMEERGMSFSSMIDDETGAINVKGMSDAAVEAWERFKYFRDTHGFSTRRGADRFLAQLDDLEQLKKQEGKILPFASRGIGSYLAKQGELFTGVKSGITLGITIAENHPPSRPVWEGFTGQVDAAASFAGEAAFRLHPWFSLPEKTKAILEPVFWKANGNPNFKITDERVRQLTGGDERAVEGFRALRDYYDKFSKESLKEALMADAAYLQQVDPAKYAEQVTKINQAVAKLNQFNYLPNWRPDAKYFVSGYDKGTGRGFLSFVDTKPEVDYLAKGLSAKNYEVLPGHNSVRRQVAPGGSFPHEYLEILKDVDPDLAKIKGERERDIKGYTQHLQTREGIPGYEPDIGRATAAHVQALAEYIAHKKYDGAIGRAIDALPQGSPEHAHWSKLRSDMRTGDGWVGKWKKGTTFYFLGANPKSTMIQYTQPITMTFPGLLEYTGVSHAASIMKQATDLTLDYLKDPIKFEAKRPELGKYIREGISRGKLSAEALREITGFARTGMENPSAVQRFFNWSMYPFANAEKQIRIHAAASAHLVFDKVPEKNRMFGGKVMNKEEFMNFFVDNTQGNYSKINLPAIARKNDMLKLMSTFRMFPATWWRQTLRLAKGRHYKALAAQLGTMGALGGIRALPFFKVFLQGLSVVYGPAKVEEMMNDALDYEGHPKASLVMEYGWPALFGMNFSGSLNVLDPSMEGTDRVDSFLGTTLGAPGGMIGRSLWRAPQVYKQTRFAPGRFGQLSRTTEAGGPIALGNVLTGLRALDEGSFRSISGEDYGVKATPGRAARRMLGLGHPLVAKAQNTYSTLYQMGEEKNESPKIRNLIRAHRMKDWDTYNRIAKELEEDEIIPTRSSIATALNAENLGALRTKAKQLGKGKTGREAQKIVSRYYNITKALGE